MPENETFCLDYERDGERDLVKTCSQVVHESDVTSWGSVFRLLLGLMVAALVSPATHKPIGVSRSTSGSLVA
jgi:hypothetical protein